MVWTPRDSGSCPPLPNKERAQRRVNPDRCAIPRPLGGTERHDYTTQRPQRRGAAETTHRERMLLPLRQPSAPGRSTPQGAERHDYTTLGMSKG